MGKAEKAFPLIVDEDTVREALPYLDVRGALTQMFRSLATDTAVQPPQTLALFPGGAGDFITYLGAMAHAQVFGAKLSPYIVTGSKPIITAWTALMSMQSGHPLMWCDAGLLTIERTAGTTALAVDQLAPPDARKLAIIGAGAVAQAHIRHLAALRPWTSILVFSRDLKNDEAKRTQVTALDERVAVSARIEDCVANADVVALCTSSGTPVLTNGMLDKPALITSISTNVANAHEVPPAWIPDMNVYCDYRQTTPASAGEMKLAAQQHGWHPRNVAGDLAELVSGVASKPSYEKHAFFRSIGLGLEDVAIAFELFRHLTAH
ncbi:ornithine cyclodeaminase family protein [Paraburkholderia rhynchosiae]|uniref:NAD(P)H-dependent anabolic L-arginine dehydrogenase DauB n=1 Tax=Paraburkholderia rhynchosiae TaxID=487049 RepID=A0A2N7WM59_9BURK|nr:ornithine cyclodeaminase family protein [Paraburkholderia rhynchosiae]PMS30516.1 ornithine cyclodeaminase [Paraburkholderia rhynchosiae]CAB3682695.1 NAD(P)H-dependent anabolic L-arginine dehydrogenase DauB [Paraburkholderia rhynchosiae]